jgi:hypothetical protein
MRKPFPVVFLVDVDNTLLDNNRVQSDFKRHIEREFGVEYGARYWTMQEEIFRELGYRDYLEALQHFRIEHPYGPHLTTAANFLVDYPFADRLYSGALEVLKRLREWGRTVILTDGDIVFQPRKVQRSGIFEAVKGHVLIYVDKERPWRISNGDTTLNTTCWWTISCASSPLSKKAWGNRVTTVFPRQGQFALDPKTIASHPAADLAVKRISDLLSHDFSALLASRQLSAARIRSSTSKCLPRFTRLNQTK